MMDFDDDRRLVEDSRAGCFLWVLVGLALLVGIIVSEWSAWVEWFQDVFGL